MKPRVCLGREESAAASRSPFPEDEGRGRLRYGGYVMSSEQGRAKRAGMTMVQAAFVVCVVGCVLAAFVPAFLRELRLSKISEASEHLALMHQRTAAYYAAERTIEGSTLRHCLPRSAGPTPAAPSVEPVEVDWSESESLDGQTWTALGFAPGRAVRYAYVFEAVTHGCDLRSPERTYLVTFRAEGDLDGDGERSIFERRAAADPETGELTPIGILYVRDRVE